MTEPTAAEQIATFATSTFKDGEASDGSPTAEETAATEANAASALAATKEDADAGDETEEAADADKVDGKAADKPADGKAAEPPPKTAGKKSAVERIGDLTAARRTAERAAESEKARADRAEAELAELKSGKTPLTPTQGDSKSVAGAPDPSKFDFGELDPKYIAALARHETVQALKDAKADDDKVRQADAAAATQREQATKTETLVKAGVKLHDDFDEVVMQGAKTGTWQLSATIGELLLDSEFGPHIAYELAKDPDEADRVYKLSAGQQAAYFGRLEAKFEAAKPSQTSKTSKTPQAPPPPKTPKGGSGSTAIGADSTDFAAVEAAYMQGALR